MCGIAGVFDTDSGAPADASLLHAMNRVQHHRGPDEGDIFVGPGVGFAHRRLSIIDLESGQQPMFNADKSICIVYNGEVYNFQELFEELRQLGYHFKTRCDTEAILHAWDAWGEDCVHRLRGMFVFAVWDERKQSVFLARDRLGIKPLYYSMLGDGKIVFASEMKAVLEHPGVARTLDHRSVEDFFSLGYVPDPGTILTSVKKLPPGHSLLLQRGARLGAPRQYWDIQFSQELAGTEDALGEELIDRLRDAVDIRMVAEVPLGAFLSGGVDSSAVVAMMSGLQSEPVNTCSIGFDVDAYDETDFAQQVATQYGTNHNVRRVDSDDFDLLDTIAAMYDEPFADSSALPTYRVCQIARQNVVVALSGDGGDELFAGYRRHRWHMNEEGIRSRLPHAIRGPLFGMAGAVYPKMDWAPRFLRAKSTLQSLAMDSLEAYLSTVSISRYEQRQALFSDALNADLQGYSSIEHFKTHAENAPTDDALALIQYIDMKTYLPGDILTKVDRASMAHSLEVRVPILDHKFIEWASGLPPSMKLRGQEGKYLFKKSLEPYLSNDVLYRDKMGFGVPLAKWFRGPLKGRLQSVLLDGGLADTGLFDPSVLKRTANEHLNGLRDHSAIIWALLMFESSTRQLGLSR